MRYEIKYNKDNCNRKHCTEVGSEILVVIVDISEEWDSNQPVHSEQVAARVSVILWL
jgi:hypothetical protein